MGMDKQPGQPIRCFEGSQEAHQAFWKWRNLEPQINSNAVADEANVWRSIRPSSSSPINAAAGDEGEAELELYGYISEWSWWEDDITPKMFQDDLYRYGKGGPITVRINSWGGDVVAASLIHTMIRDYPGRVTAQIDGIAASAATVVALAGDVVKIQQSGYFMIHDPSVVFFMAQLNIEDLTRMATSLQAVKEGIVNAYETKTGLSRARLSKLMTDETWMDAQKAVDLGFVDEVVQQEKKLPIVIPQNAAVVNALGNYSKVPAAILEAIAGCSITAPVQLSDDEQREADALSKRVSKITKKEM